MSDDFFATPAIEWEDLPTVQELLRAADANRLVDAMLQGMGAGHLSKKKLKRVRKGMKKSFRAFCDVSDVKPSKKWLITGQQTLSVDLEGVGISYQICTSAVRRKSLPLARKFLENNVPLEELTSIKPDAEYPPLYGYAYEFTPAKKLLGYRVWMSPTLDLLGRYALLADIFDELTFFGTVPGQQEQTSKEEHDVLLERIDAANQPQARLVPMAIWTREFFGAPASGFQTDLEIQADKRMWKALKPSSDALLREHIAELARLSDMLDQGYRARPKDTEDTSETSSDCKVYFAEGA